MSYSIRLLHSSYAPSFEPFLHSCSCVQFVGLLHPAAVRQALFPPPPNLFVVTPSRTCPLSSHTLPISWLFFTLELIFAQTSLTALETPPRVSSLIYFLSSFSHSSLCGLPPFLPSGGFPSHLLSSLVIYCTPPSLKELIVLFSFFFPLSITGFGCKSGGDHCQTFQAHPVHQCRRSK